jgi:hypothetical protein
MPSPPKMLVRRVHLISEDLQIKASVRLKLVVPAGQVLTVDLALLPTRRLVIEVDDKILWPALQTPSLGTQIQQTHDMREHQQLEEQTNSKLLPTSNTLPLFIFYHRHGREQS